MLRRQTKIQQPPPAGPFAIVITGVDADSTSAAHTETPAWYRGEFARNEEERPEPVILTIPLLPTVDQERAVQRAAAVASALNDRYKGQQRFLANHRVKVVPARTR